MTGSPRALIALTALAVLLGIAVALDRPPSAVARSARLLEGFDPDEVTRVTLPGAVLERVGDAWQVNGQPADAAAVSDVLGALELAAAERWDAGGVTDRPIVVEGARRYELELGAPTPTGQVWARRAGERRAALIAGWVGRALDRDAASLRRRVVVTTDRPTGIELHADGVDLVTSGDPPSAHLGVGKVRLAPAKAAALADAVAGLRLATFPTDAPPARIGTLRVLGGAEVTEIDDLGPCPGDPSRRWTGGTAGVGCVDGWNAVLDAARAILDDALAAVDPSPVAAAKVMRLELGDAIADAHGGDWLLTRNGEELPADDPSIDALVAALARPGRVVPFTGRSEPTLRVTHDGGASEALAVVDSVAGRALRRDDEPFAIVVDPAVLDALALGAGGLVDRELVAEDWTRLSRVTIQHGATRVDATRGASLESWSSHAEVVVAIRDLLIDLRAESLVAEPVTAPARTILLHYEPPPTPDGEPVDLELRIAPEPGGRCRVTVDGTVSGIVASAACAVLLSEIR